MKKLHKTLMIGAVVVGAATLLGANQASAFLGGRGKDKPQPTEEQRAAMQQVWEDKDYQGWLELVADHPKAKDMTEEQFMEKAEHRESMQTIMENQDYQGWLELVGDRPIAEEISEDEFARFIEMHELKRAGDHDGAKAIAEELGLSKMGKKHRGERGEGRHK